MSKGRVGLDDHDSGGGREPTGGDEDEMNRFWDGISQTIREHIFSCMEIEPETPEIKELFRTEQKILKAAFRISIASSQNKSAFFLFTLWDNLQTLRGTFLEMHKKIS